MMMVMAQGLLEAPSLNTSQMGKGQMSSTVYGGLGSGGLQTVQSSIKLNPNSLRS